MEKKNQRLLVGIFLIIINISLQIINFVSCKNGLYANSCSIFRLNYGIWYSFWYNILFFIGIYLIITNYTKIRLKNIITKLKPNNFDSKKNPKNRKNNNLKNKSYICILTLLLISFIINIFLLHNQIDLKSTISSQDEIIKQKEKELNEKNNDLLKVLQGFSASYTINKLNFLNEKIVFVIEGYEKYYMNYDCMRRKTLNKQYKFLALNEDNALKQGYKKYNCDIITKEELHDLNKYG